MFGLNSGQARRQSALRSKLTLVHQECLAAKEESDASNAAGLLGRMLALLIAERAETSSQPAQQDPSILGPCLEYVLKHAILATLVKLTVKDEPEGIRRHVIDWFDDALQQLEETFLTHVAVHSSMYICFLL